MAFSMFFRSPVCSNHVMAQQVMRLATHSSLSQSVKSLPLKSIALKQSSTTPLLNAVRSFRTSAVSRSAEKGGDHAKLWVIERLASVALVPLLPLALIAPNKVTDSLLAIIVTAHSFWGLEAIAVDYVRASLFGPVLPKIAIGLVYLISIATLGGLFYVISHDIGIANSIKAFWAVKSNQTA